MVNGMNESFRNEDMQQKCYTDLQITASTQSCKVT